jgi:hypothetical protein
MTERWRSMIERLQPTTGRSALLLLNSLDDGPFHIPIAKSYETGIGKFI